MAKKKDEQIPAEEIVEAPEAEATAEPAKDKGVDVDAFIERKLKVINMMPNKVKAQSAVKRLMRHKEVR